MDTTFYGGLEQRLKASRAKLTQRLVEISPALERPTVTVAGFGVRGRPMACFLRDVLDKDVRIMDTTVAGRRAAIEAGFDLCESGDQVDNRQAVILGACQYQVEQARQYPDNYVYYGEASYFYNLPLYFNYMRDFSQWIIDNWCELLEFVAEQQLPTRTSLEAILRYRLSMDPVELSKVAKPMADMWFDIPENHRKRRYSCFLDVGAYDGDTLDSAVQRRLGFTRAIAVEANPDFRDDIMSRKGSFPGGLEVIPCAAWSKSAKLDATEHVSGMVTVTESQNGSIKAEPLDKVVHAPVDFVKMDIEGAEGSALAGATRLLSSQPDLAVAAYHRPDDILTIYRTVTESVDKSRDEYRFYVGHYSEWQDDTILYFLAPR